MSLSPVDAGQPTQMLLSLTNPSHMQPLSSHTEAIIADIPYRIVINPQLVSLTASPRFKRVIQLAVEHALRDVRFCVYPTVRTYR